MEKREKERKREKGEKKKRKEEEKAEIRPSYELAAVRKLKDLVESYVVVLRNLVFKLLRLSYLGSM